MHMFPLLKYYETHKYKWFQDRLCYFCLAFWLLNPKKTYSSLKSSLAVSVISPISNKYQQQPGLFPPARLDVYLYLILG